MTSVPPGLGFGWISEVLHISLPLLQPVVSIIEDVHWLKKHKQSRGLDFNPELHTSNPLLMPIGSPAILEEPAAWLCDAIS